jgi:hypothetical protein
LYIRINDFSTETLYIGLSAESDNDGNLNSSFVFRIKDPDGIVVHPQHQVSMDNDNAETWSLATAGPDVLNPGSGYSTAAPYSVFSPAAVGKNGDYYIEFADNFPGIVNIKWFDFTVVKNGQEELGRLWSHAWALRTPPATGAAPECDWDRPFNSSFYSYTVDGFVSKIDFSDSGFKGLSTPDPAIQVMLSKTVSQRTWVIQLLMPGIIWYS